jgi:hypothetical protein
MCGVMATRGTPSNDDQALLERAYAGSMSLGPPFINRLEQTDPGWSGADLVGWELPMPLRFELQVRELALPCADALEVGGLVLQRRYSAMGIHCTRFLQESLAVLQWLTQPTDPTARQGRSFGLMQRDLPRLKRLTERLAMNETNPKARDGFIKRGGQVKAAIKTLPDLARVHGVTTIRKAPGRQEMLDEMLGKHAGHAFFSATSELVSHPGLMHFVGFADPDTGDINVNLTGLVAQRAFWITAQATLFSDIAIATANGLGWAGWVDEVFQPVARQLDPVREEVSRRIDELA